MPSSRHARATRKAISPRFAISTLSNKWTPLSVDGLEGQQPVAELDRRRVGDEHLDHPAGRVGLDRDGELHRLDDADLLARPDLVPRLDEGPRAGLRSPVER